MFSQTDVDTYQFIRGTDLKRRETAFATIYLNTATGDVHVVERWFYTFTVAAGQAAWTDDEKNNFHYALTSAVGATWDSQPPFANSTDPIVQQFLSFIRKAHNVRIGVSGANAFAFCYASQGLDIDFDIVLTSNNPHWRVTLQKIPATSNSRSNVNWDSRHIELFSQDNSPGGACQDPPAAQCATGFVTTPHEFGHTLLKDDEYTAGSPSRADLQSIMNIGTIVRPRHLSFITSQLNTMLPGCSFRAA